MVEDGERDVDLRGIMEWVLVVENDEGQICHSMNWGNPPPSTGGNLDCFFSF